MTVLPTPESITDNFIKTGRNGIANNWIAHGNVLYVTNGEEFTPIFIRLSENLLLVNSEKMRDSHKEMYDIIHSHTDKISPTDWYPIMMKGSPDLKIAFELNNGDLKRIKYWLRPVPLQWGVDPLPVHYERYYNLCEKNNVIEWSESTSLIEKHAACIKRMGAQHELIDSYISSYQLWHDVSKIQSLLSVPEILEKVKQTQTIDSDTLKSVVDARKAFDSFIEKVDGYIYAMTMFPQKQSVTTESEGDSQ